eukprot:4021543-Pyramimonas_sp.AAC.1
MLGAPTGWSQPFLSLARSKRAAQRAGGFKEHPLCLHPLHVAVTLGERPRRRGVQKQPQAHAAHAHQMDARILPTDPSVSSTRTGAP